MNTLEQLVELGLSQNEIAKKLGIPRGTVSSRLKKLNIHTVHNKFNNIEIKAPSCMCGESDVNNFYGHKKSQCKKCFTKSVTDAGNSNKMYGVSLLGEKCSLCGYNKSMRALEFHHTNPSIKDKNFKSLRGWSKDRLTKELQSCILLCSNCHAEEHERLDMS